MQLLQSMRLGLTGETHQNQARRNQNVSVRCRKIAASFICRTRNPTARGARKPSKGLNGAVPLTRDSDFPAPCEVERGSPSQARRGHVIYKKNNGNERRAMKRRWIRRRRDELELTARGRKVLDRTAYTWRPSRSHVPDQIGGRGRKSKKKNGRKPCSNLRYK